MKVSVAIVARDAEKQLPNCLGSVRKLTDDIVVIVDKRSTDGTSRIAEGCGAKVYWQDFDNFAGQKNYAVSLTKYRWVLSLDADETASDALVKAVSSLPDTPLFCAYRISRKNKIWGKYIEHSNWDPNGLIRLFDKTQCHWSGEVHEEITGEGTMGQLCDPIYHDNYRTVSEFVDRQNTYSSMTAAELAKRASKFSYFQFFWQPKFDFFRRYVWHAGFLDGNHGLFLSYMMVIYHLSVWIKLWQTENAVQV